MYSSKVKHINVSGIKLILLSFVLISCKHEPDIITIEPPKPLPYCDSTVINFSTDVMPYVNASCAVPGCHDNKGPAAGIDLSSYDAIMNSKVKGINIVKPGDALNSKFCRVLYLLDLVPMPPPFNLAIAPKGRDNLVKWVQQGAKNNEPCQVQCDTTQFTFKRQIGPLINKYCAGCNYGSYNSGNILLSNYREIKAVVDSSKLYEAMTATNGVKKMPTGVVDMQPCEVIQVRKWIESGAPNN